MQNNLFGGFGGYGHISKYKGRKNWAEANIHDDGMVQSAGGGKSTLSLGMMGVGKSTLGCYSAQECMYLNNESKKKLVEQIASAEPGDIIDTGKCHPETVIWRGRESDSFSNILPENWKKNLEMKGVYKPVKNVHLFVHEYDELVFYQYPNHEPIAVEHLPVIERYESAADIMHKLHWGEINVVYEPQTYVLSNELVQRLKERKMDNHVLLVKEDTKKKPKKDPKEPKKEKQKNSYANKEVKSAYFWFDIFLVCRMMNKQRHIQIMVDEWDDVVEARPEGDAWKLAEDLANGWKDLRRANISTHLSTHQTDFVDWRILKRIDYLVWMRGSTVHPNYSCIKRQSIVSNLPMGQYIIETRTIDFGIMEFDKIANKQTDVRVDGLKGYPRILNRNERQKIAQTLVEAK
jgi:hypothetical protein